MTSGFPVSRAPSPERHASRWRLAGGFFLVFMVLPVWLLFSVIDGANEWAGALRDIAVEWLKPTQIHRQGKP
jgi:hypothetical protein